MDRRELLRTLTLSIASAALAPRFAFGQGADPDVELTLTAAPGEVSLIPGEATRVWQFTGGLIKGPAGTLATIPGSYLGPVIRLRRGQHVRIRFINKLAEDSIVHWHGLDVPETADGHPRLAVGAGHDYVYDFTVTNRAGTYWYHPHPHMRTGPQVNQGLAGLLLVTDDEETALGLPSGERELLCVLQDRRLDARHQFSYLGGGMMEMMNGFLGDRMFVSGLPPSTREVDTAWHRVRLLNGSNARIYKLAWSHGAPITVIGGDGGLLERHASQKYLTLAPGQRADVLLDLTGVAPGTDVHLDSVAFPAADAGSVGMMGSSSPVPNGAPLRLMTLRTRRHEGAAFRLPERFSTFDASWAIRSDAPVRRVPLVFQRMQWLLAGRQFGMEDVAADETVKAGTTQVWELVNQNNGMGMQAAHPIHVHGRQFRVLSRTGGAAANALGEGIADAGWTDTVLVLPGETVRIQIPFTTLPGLYLYHCHILEHEDMGMMRNFRVV